MVQNEQEVIRYLNIPSIPKKQWDGVKSFTKAVAILYLVDGGKSYAVASFDSNTDKAPRITKVFTLEPYKDWEIVGVVPEYMNQDDIDKWDVPQESIAAAKQIISEVEEMENEGVIDEMAQAPNNEYCYDFITNDEEAQAYIRSWNKQHGIRGRAPKSHDGIITKLTAMWMQDNKNK